MPTKNPRINITFDPHEQALLSALAKHQHKSVAGLAKELILEALDRQEDMVLSQIGDARIEEAEKDNEEFVAHDQAWK